MHDKARSVIAKMCIAVENKLGVCLNCSWVLLFVLEMKGEDSDEAINSPMQKNINELRKANNKI